MMQRQPIVPIDIGEEMKKSYLAYSMSTLVDRALPDARDGLKPSQRRILVAMNDLGLTPGRQHRKCANIAGHTSGNYHPHGEMIVYPTLVNLAQDFKMRYPLVDGQGTGFSKNRIRYGDQAQVLEVCGGLDRPDVGCLQVHSLTDFTCHELLTLSVRPEVTVPHSEQVRKHHGLPPSLVFLEFL